MIDLSAAESPAKPLGSRGNKEAVAALVRDTSHRKATALAVLATGKGPVETEQIAEK
jgi:hypothetical protein